MSRPSESNSHAIDIDDIEDLHVRVQERVGDLTDREIQEITLSVLLRLEHRVSELSVEVADLTTAVQGVSDRIATEVANLEAAAEAASAAAAAAQAAQAELQTALDQAIAADVADDAAFAQQIADLQAQLAAANEAQAAAAADAANAVNVIKGNVDALNALAQPPAPEPAPEQPTV